MFLPQSNSACDFFIPKYKGSREGEGAKNESVTLNYFTLVYVIGGLQQISGDTHGNRVVGETKASNGGTNRRS